MPPCALAATASTHQGAARQPTGPMARVGTACSAAAQGARARARRVFPGGMRVLVKGFVSNMSEWMSACNVIVTKAGPGTIAEALICGLPVVLNGFIPCQARTHKRNVLHAAAGEPARRQYGWPLV